VTDADDDGSSTDALGRLFAAQEAGGRSEQYAAARVRAALLGSAAQIPGLARYRLRRVLGEGAMGQVWLADDPELSRQVAIKLVRAQAGERNLVHAQRLAREARAMARISHPNVVQIFDVGTHGDDTEVFIVMEYVDGETLAQWLSCSPARPHREVLGVFLQAAAGLDAAHHAGLVHRDFKPANVLLGQDGRARVGDFGLARTDHEARRAYATGPLDDELSITQGGSLTESGAVVGTPLYMAPEQHTGDDADTRSDQYAFCVALYEGLAGRRPFQGKLAEVSRAKFSRELVEPLPGRAIAEPVLAVLHRGLDPDPSRRWESMAALSWALRRASAPRRRWVAAALAGVATATVLGLTQDPTNACAAGEIQWDHTRRSSVVAALTTANGETAAANVVDRLDEIATTWRSRALEVCERADRRAQVCVREVGTQFDATVSLLVDGDPRAVGRAAAAVEGLPGVDGCSTEDEADRSEVDAHTLAMRDELAEAAAIGRAGSADEALALAMPVREAAVAQGEDGRAIAAVAAFEIGFAYQHADRHDEAVPWLRTAYFEALAIGDDRTAVAAVPPLAIHMATRRDFEAADEWMRHADALVARRPPTLVVQRTLMTARAAIAAIHGDTESAARLLRETMQLAEEQGSDVGWLSAARNLSTALLRHGALDECLALRREVVDRSAAVYGPDALATAHARVAYAEVLANRDRRAALDELRGAQAVLVGSGAAAHGGLATAYFTESMILGRLGEFAGAIVASEKAVSVLERFDGANLGRRAAYLASLGSARDDAGDVDGALRDLGAALDLLGDGPTHEAAEIHLARGYILRKSGRHAEAAQDARTARAILRSLASPSVGRILATYADEGFALRSAGRCPEALVSLGEGAAWAGATPALGVDAIVFEGEVAVALHACGQPAAGLERLLAARGSVPAGSPAAGGLAIAHARMLGEDRRVERGVHEALAHVIGLVHDDAFALTELEALRRAHAAVPSSAPG
jgi:tetratricopeptide (TPR) repeat protein